MPDPTFATAINCMDGRTQLPVIEYLKRRYGVAYVDMITEPGPNKILAEHTDSAIVADIRKCVTISVKRHNSKVVAVVGHHDCAGNPASDEEQKRQIQAALDTVESWNLGVELVGLWVDERWQVQAVQHK